MTKRDGTKGDLLVSVEVVVPAGLTDDQRAALTSFADTVGAENPRAKLFTSA